MISSRYATEIANYFSTSPEKIIQEYAKLKDFDHPIKWIKKTVREWQENNISEYSRPLVERWFKETDNYIFELMEVQSSPLRQKLNQTILTFLKRHHVSCVLDYGGGVGENSLQAARQGFQAVLADLPGKTLDFARWRILQHKLPVEIITITNKQPLKGRYFDAITCLEVFQHLFNPLTTARYLYQHLHKEGYFLVTTRFNNPSYPPALKKNRRYENIFSKKLENIDFKFREKIYQWGNKEKAKYLYIYQKTS